MIKEVLSPLIGVIDSLKNEKRPIFLYGMGNGAEKIYSYLTENGISVSGVVASEGFLRSQSFLGFDVCSIPDAEKRFGDLCLVLCFGLEGEKAAILKNVSKRHRLVSPNLPVFGVGACDKKFIFENIEKFEKVFELLADDISKEIYLGLLKYNVTGDIGYLNVGNDSDVPEAFYNHTKRHIDVGAYDGDTAIEFTRKSDKYRDIIAFEPDRTTFKHLKENVKDLRNVVPENYAVGKKDGYVVFDSGKGRASHCGEGGATINCVSIDSYCGFNHIKANGTDVGSIKIDAEGMDEEVIFGAVNTIYCCKPHICVALYHRAEDIIELPLLLRKHNNKYKFYLRKKEYVPAWDVFTYAIHQE